MSSFTMQELLRLNGKEEYLHQPQLTRQVAIRLRRMGYKLRVVKVGRNHWRVWSNEVTGDYDVSANEPEKWESMADDIVKRLPIGNIQLPGARWLE